MARGLALIVSLAGGLGLVAPAQGATSLPTSLAAQMRKGGGATGALVVDAATGKTVYTLRERTRRMPG